MEYTKKYMITTMNEADTLDKCINFFHKFNYSCSTGIFSGEVESFEYSKEYAEKVYDYFTGYKHEKILEIINDIKNENTEILKSYDLI